jgi:hypothetical protein
VSVLIASVWLPSKARSTLGRKGRYRNRTTSLLTMCLYLGEAEQLPPPKPPFLRLQFCLCFCFNFCPTVSFRLPLITLAQIVPKFYLAPKFVLLPNFFPAKFLWGPEFLVRHNVAQGYARCDILQEDATSCRNATLKASLSWEVLGHCLNAWSKSNGNSHR